MGRIEGGMNRYVWIDGVDGPERLSLTAWERRKNSINRRRVAQGKAPLNMDDLIIGAATRKELGLEG